jgi:hypothetical protein
MEPRQFTFGYLFSENSICELFENKEDRLPEMRKLC